VPAGSPVWVRASECKDQLFIFLEPGGVTRVAAEAFDLDPARVSVPPLDGLDLPQLRAAMGAVGVQLLRQVLAPRQPARGRDGALPRDTLRAVVAYIEAHLDAGLTLAQLAAAAHRSAYHFARQVKAATGVPPHQYVIARRGARRLLGSKPILPALQARRRPHTGTIPPVRKHRLKDRKPRQEPGPRVAGGEDRSDRPAPTGGDRGRPRPW
jgi:hypothetical protein